jgi:hypothetical protein
MGNGEYSPCGPQEPSTHLAVSVKLKPARSAAVVTLPPAPAEPWHGHPRALAATSASAIGVTAARGAFMARRR